MQGGGTMKRFLACAVALMGLLLAGNAFGDGNKLLTQCENALSINEGEAAKVDSIARAGFCLGMMQGMTSMNGYYQTLLGKKALFCLPEGVTNGQAARVVVKYLKEHPEKLHEHESSLALWAFVEAFPCK